MSDGRALIVQGDALHLPLPDGSVDLVVTSPPYWALRSYSAGPGEIGSEPTPQAFLEALWAATAEMARVLKPTGSIFVDLGDKYNSAMGAGNGRIFRPGHGSPKWANDPQPRGSALSDVPPKSLMLLPERYRIGCVDQTSPYYRAEFYQQLANDLIDGETTPERARQLAAEFEASPKSKGLGLIARAVIVWCLSGGARVYARTPTGDRPMMLRDLARAYQPENVQLWNGHKWTQVLGWNRTPDDDGALELEFRSGERVGCTPNHQWPTTDGLKRADALRVGDVVLQTGLPEPDRPRHPTDLHPGVTGWLVGLYIAEGSRSGTTIQIAGHVNEIARHARLAQIAEAYDGTCAVYQTSENGVTCNLRGPVLAGIIDQYVSPGTAKTKRLRKAAWQRSNLFLAAVVEGYLEGDGHYDAKNDRWRLAFTANDEWAADLRTLAARLGARLRLRRGASSFDGRSFPGWRGEWRWKRPARSKPDTEIIAIRRSRARDFYDLGVADEPHLFALASGVLTHNSKPNGLPESVTDRVRRSHEDWVHLTKSPRYYAATDEIREPHDWSYAQRRLTSTRINPDLRRDRQVDHPLSDEPTVFGHPLGKLPGSVWSIPSEPLRLPDHLGVQHYACVDEQTEILTSRGWLGHQELEAGDWVAGYDLGSGTSNWTVCEAVHRYQHDGPMVAVEKRDLSMRLTPNHRQVVMRQGQPGIVQADDLGPQHFIPRSTPWQDQLEGEVLGVPLAALLGWVAAEGWYTRTGQVRISQSRTANPAKVATLDKILAAIDLPDPDRSERRKYRRALDAVQRTERERTWRDARWVDVLWALPLGLSQQIRQLMPGKRLSITAINLPAAERTALLEAFIDGDGHRRPSGRISIFQKERHNLDVLQAIAVTLGYKTTLRFTGNRWVLYLTQGGRPITLRGTNGINAPIPREHYKGIVWCPQTATGTFIARRNGSVFVTGNSFPSEWPRRLILGFSPPGICVDCGTGRVPVVEREYERLANHLTDHQRGNRDNGWDRTTQAPHGMARMAATILGYACSCTPHTNHPGSGEQPPRADYQFAGGIQQHANPGGGLGNSPKYGPWREYHWDRWTPPPTRPAIILDPFAGTGTTPMVARALGRIGVGVDLSHAYCRAARWRVKHDGAKAISRTNLERQQTLL